jgi:hypothetical protein
MCYIIHIHSQDATLEISEPIQRSWVSFVCADRVVPLINVLALENQGYITTVLG